ncbi:MAG: hypothetical protein NTU47_04280 [Ignavibacteriales bacterium]|nr:hypothetical protein [Ignavibacteriales bacterium]
MPSKRESIRKKAIELLKANPEGLRWTELLKGLQKALPDIVPKTIAGSTWNLDLVAPDQVYKPARGLWKYKGKETDEVVEEVVVPASVKEENFYAPFAEWIKNELGECTEAVAFGGNSLSKKWGTPDVIGVYRPRKRDVVQFDPEVLSAEIKVSAQDPTTAFGQAIAYRLFSSKVYIVEPVTLSPADLDRLEALCLLFGVGLVLFTPDIQNPNFTIRTRAQKYNPDMFWVNEFADKLYSVNKDAFSLLFG